MPSRQGSAQPTTLNPTGCYTVPVVVAGGGACGAVAALAAREIGIEVLVIEQDDPPRGSTAMSQGLICAAGTAAQRRAGVKDDPNRFFADIMTKTKGKTDPRLTRTIADEAGPTVDWLITVHGLPLDLDRRFRPSYGHSVARVHGWIGRSGVDLIQFLHHRLDATGTEVALRARLVDLLADPAGAVEAVVIERPDGTRETIGCGALVLATSGFGANRAMVATHAPELAEAAYHGHEGNTGVGIELGARLGGALGDMGSYQGYGMLAHPHGIPLPPGHIVEGGILLNGAGKRFVNEIDDIAGMIHPVLAQKGEFVWAIYDEAIEARCAYMPETQQLMALHAARAAGSIDGLANIMEVPAATLHAVFADAAEAYAYGRPDSAGRVWGNDLPPTAPFRALKVRGALFHTQGGLQIDAAGRVLRADGTGLPNLFAGGGAARGVSGPSYWGYLPAMGLCAAVTFGRLAGQSAALTVRG
jgi:fumarate reductase flavoprotein subunit